MITLALHALGCRLNEAELEQTARVLERAGHVVVRLEDNPDMILLNTCSVTTEAMRKSRQIARKLCSHAPKCIVVMGCALDLMPEGENFFEFDEKDDLPTPDILMIRVKDKPRAGDIIVQYINEHPELFDTTHPNAKTYTSHTRAFIKIEDGCNNQCTYCSVRLARGRERSESTEQILRDIKIYEARGCHEIILTGVQLGAWKENDRRLPELVRAILSQTSIERIRLSSIEPWHIRENLWRLWCTEPRLCPHFHIPVQSGSDAVLTAMRRRTPIPAYLSLLHDLRSNIPDVRISTDLIVGFPGESEENWQETIDFIKAARFDDVHLFRFSARPGTLAYDMPDPVAPDIKKARWNEAEALINKIASEQLKQFDGRTYPVLWESSHAKSHDAPTSAGGYSPNYLRFNKLFDNPASMRGKITNEVYAVPKDDDASNL